jgi:hypothetical protein
VGTDPEIWRTIDLPEALTLDQLHLALQAAFGWQNSHLHRFTEDDPYALSRGIPRIGRAPRAWVDQWSLMESDIEGEEDEAETTLGEAMEHDGPLFYEYDMGDGWIHRLELIERRDGAPGEQPVTIVAGEGRGPFEDSGGVGGYREKLEILADPRHPEHAEITEWAEFIAGPWGALDPDDADLEGVQAELDALFGEAADDMSGLVDESRGILPESPIAEFASGLPVPYRVNLRRHLRRTQLLEPAPIETQSAAELVRPYLWLLDRIGVDGMQLTDAGWMPPAAVLEGMTTLGWRQPWYGQANREESAPPIRMLRESAEGMRLIRKVKGRLQLVARTRRLVADPEALCRQVAWMLLRQRMTEGQAIAGTLLALGIADASISTRDSATYTVLGMMNELGYADQEGRPLDERWFHALTAPVLAVFSVLGLWQGIAGQDEPPTQAMQLVARLALR